MIVDFHTHTYHSYDSLMQPTKILKLAYGRGLNAIVINDHNTIKGGVECKAKNPYKDMEVIIGAEIKTDIGDVTGIFLKEEITAYKYSDVITQIKLQGGITILNHPFVSHNLSEMNFDGIDLIEGYNGRLNKLQNKKAVELALKLGKPLISGSDAHVYDEVARCKTHYDSPIDYLKPLRVEYIQCSVMSPIKSQLIKSYKTKDPVLFLKVLLGSPKKIIKRIMQ